VAQGLDSPLLEFPHGPQAGATTRLLDIENLKVAAATGEIVRGVDLSIGRNQVVGLLGESGCGKTTLALAVVGLLRGGRRVIGGSVKLEGNVIVTRDVDRSPELRGRVLGFVPQDPFSALNPLRKIGPQVGRGLLVHRTVPKGQIPTRVKEMLDAMGIPDPNSIVHKYPHELSGGQRQRAAIAAALITHPKLVVADEPTSALDVIVQAQVLDKFVELANELETSVLLVSHDIGCIAERCGRVTAMYAGRVVEFGDTIDVLTNPRHPYVAGLLRSTPQLFGTIGPRLASIAGQPPAIPGELDSCPFAPRCERSEPICVQIEPEYSWPAPAGFACHRPLPVAAGADDEVAESPMTESALRKQVAGMPPRVVAVPDVKPSRPTAQRRTRLRGTLTLGLSIYGAILFVSLAAPLLPLRNPDAQLPQGLASSGAPLNPNLTFLLGTDGMGRDELSRLLYGGRVTFLAATLSVLLAAIVGLTIGLAAAVLPRWFGNALMRATDIGLAVPGLLLAATLGVILGPGVTSLTVALAAVFWAPLARVTYGQALVIVEKPFIESARVAGARTLRIMFREALPHVLPVTAAYAALAVGWAALFESTLGFIGVGVQEPTPSIGTMLGSGLAYYQTNPGLIAFPTLYLGLLVTATTLIGEGLRHRYVSDASLAPTGRAATVLDLRGAA